MSSKVDPEILRLYTIRRRLGKGVHGAVWKAVDRWTGEVVAIKKIYNAFRNLTDAQRTFREVIFLKEVDHPNIIKMKDVIPAENDRDIYLIFEFMGVYGSDFEPANLKTSIQECPSAMGV
uniref:Protein kinase domain-containing protein n=1 Tax=Eptatretus burgeri TaxID=7764 RepID=A0A8C4Q663_EPTBU